jgi:hypothetical protein
MEDIKKTTIETGTYILVPVNMIDITPNDAELGEKVRNLYWESQNK